MHMQDTHALTLLPLLLQVSLFEVMPSMCVGDLVRILNDYARDQ
jgi:hypothetical protein